ncbi:MAG TPA: nuclear transport factor 2 family protein [Pyrinomonadaceae bacterium]|nr:nuclear transport factor 2 family protein [Pyrinomonadaceae bacterium]
MKKFIIMFAVIGIGSLLLGYKVMADDRELARVPLDHYLQGHSTGNPEFMRKAFHPEARIMSFRDGKMTNLSVEEFAGRFSGKLAEDEVQRKRTIESIDVFGNAASAKIVLDYPNIKFTDYMNLLKIDGEWKIVNKSFHAEPKQKSPK